MFIIVMFVGIIVSYLMGSICSAVLVSKMFNLPDPRQFGSNNPGATNVLRLSGKKYAIIVLLADVFKGLIPVAIANILGVNQFILGFMGLATVAGHIYPLFFQFKGGKGVATALGALFGLNVFLGLAACITWLIVAIFARYSSLSSIIAIMLSPFYAIWFENNAMIFIPLFIMALLILYKHHKNIIRLIHGEEPTINWKK